MIFSPRRCPCQLATLVRWHSFRASVLLGRRQWEPTQLSGFAQVVGLYHEQHAGARG